MSSAVCLWRAARPLPLLLLLLAALLPPVPETQAAPLSVVFDPISIAAFNVQRFGINKMNKPDVMDLLVRILSQYDLTLVQEIVDISETAIHNLTARLSQTTGFPYSVQLSPRVGKNSFEQYGYVYRTDRLQVRDARMYPDTRDVFEREPYIVTFTSDQLRNLNEFTLIGIHTKPTSANTEIDALSDVLDFVQGEMGVSDIVLLGDFNAGCSYVTQTEWAVNRLKNREDVVWGIADHIDTTVSSTNCAYDRVILKGERMLASVVAESVGVFRYDQPWSIEFDLAEDVSDHYPVHLKLKPKNVRAAERVLHPLEVFAVTDTRGVSAADVMELILVADTASYTVRPLYSLEARLTKVEASYKSYKLSGEGILNTLSAFQRKFPRLVTDYDLGLLRYKISAGALDDPSVYDSPSRPRWYSRVDCTVGSSPRCQVLVEKRTLVA